MTVLLTIDTASPTNSVALLTEEGSTVRASCDRGWAETLLHQADLLLTERGLTARVV